MAGRRIKCDRDKATERATLRFWRGGFAGTSVADLVADTGLNRFCLYGEFGGKKGLFLKACEIYSRRSRERMLEPLRACLHPAAGLRELFSNVIDALTDPSRPQGCLIANASADADPDIRLAVRRHFTDFEETFTEVLHRAAGAEVNRDAAQRGARLLVTTILGLVQSLRLGVSAEAMRQTASMAIGAALRGVGASETP